MRITFETHTHLVPSLKQTGLLKYTNLRHGTVDRRERITTRHPKNSTDYREQRKK